MRDMDKAKLDELEGHVRKFIDETQDVEAEAVAWLALGLIDIVREKGGTQ